MPTPQPQPVIPGLTRDPAVAAERLGPGSARLAPLVRDDSLNLGQPALTPPQNLRVQRVQFIGVALGNAEQVLGQGAARRAPQVELDMGGV